MEDMVTEWKFIHDGWYGEHNLDPSRRSRVQQWGTSGTLRGLHGVRGCGNGVENNGEGSNRVENV